MNILLVTEFFPQDKLLRFTGGVEARTYYLARELSRHHHVQTISRPAAAISATAISILPRFWFMFTAIIKSLFLPADIVEGSNFVTYLPAFLIAKIKRVPAVAWYADVFLGTWQQKFGLSGFFGELVEWLSLKLPWDKFIALSQVTRQKLIAVGIPASKITVVYAGVDQAEINQVRARKSSQPSICCIARLVSYKRVNDLIQAFTLIKKHLPKTQLIIIGTGPEQTRLKSLTHEPVTWKKDLTRTELIRGLKQAHVFCLPSLVEGFGLVTLEAIAAGTPYVNADIPINREITHHNLGGLLFHPQDPSDLARKITVLLIDQQLYSRKLAEGQQLLTHYSWSKQAQATETVYHSVVK